MNVQHVVLFRDRYARAAPEGKLAPTSIVKIDAASDDFSPIIPKWMPAGVGIRYQRLILRPQWTAGNDICPDANSRADRSALQAFEYCGRLARHHVATSPGRNLAQQLPGFSAVDRFQDTQRPLNPQELLAAQLVDHLL
jgi:hypothetical protein